MAERDEIKKVRKWLKENHPEVFCFKHYGGAFSQIGIPDLIICINGKFVAIEMKAPGEKPTPAQEKTLEAVIKANGYSAWFDNHQNAIEWIKGILRAR